MDGRGGRCERGGRRREERRVNWLACKINERNVIKKLKKKMESGTINQKQLGV